MVRLDLGPEDEVKLKRIGFTGQRVTAYGGLADFNGMSPTQYVWLT